MSTPKVTYAQSQIPLQIDTPSYSMRVTLTGVVYTLHFAYNGRIDRYYVSVHDDKDNPIVTGMRVICDWMLMRKCQSTGRPKGEIVFSDTTKSGDPPGLHELGRRVLCYYIEPVVTP